MPALISFNDIGKSFDQKPVLHSISFDVEKGGCVALLGRSGCGKSTLLKILLGIYPADNGTVLINGAPADITKLRRTVGYASQENSFYDTLTVEENILYYASRHSMHLTRQQRKDLLASMRLEGTANTLAGSISGGQKRRLDVALSLVHDPSILILDEPTTGLDPILVEEFWELIARMRKDGKTVLVVTHHLDDVERHCSKAIFLKEGRVAKEMRKVKGVADAFLRHA